MNTPAPAHALPNTCPNCEAPVFGPYCAQCGQETVINQLTLREFGHEYIQNFVSLEGRLWRTLWVLVRHPGRLTVEFLQGRRRRYVRPLPLYFSTSFMLFLAMALFPGQLVQVNENDGPPPGLSSVDTPKKKPISINTGPSRPASAIQGSIDDVPALLRPLVTRIRASSQRLNADPDYGTKRLSTAMLAKLPYAVFFLVPAFAVATRLFYWRRRRGYAEHFLFALHLHSFAFLSLLPVYALTEQLAPLLFLGGWAYLALALRTLFGGRLWPQVLRAMLLMWCHAMVLGGVMLLVLALSFLSI